MEKINSSTRHELGLVLGSFCPPHEGHLALFDFAGSQVDQLIIALCARPDDEISGEIRFSWLKEMISRVPHAFLLDYVFDEHYLLPWGKDGSSRDASRVWAAYFLGRYYQRVPQVIFTSEDYGDYMAEYMGIKHIPFDKERRIYPVSSRWVRKAPQAYKEMLPAEVKEYYNLGE